MAAGMTMLISRVLRAAGKNALTFESFAERDILPQLFLDGMMRSSPLRARRRDELTQNAS